MRYTIAEHAISNPNLSGIRHKWVYQNISGASNTKVNYTKSANNSSSWFEVQAKAEENSRFDSKFCMMRFLTVPQDVTGTLTVVIGGVEYNFDIALSGHTHNGQIWPVGLVSESFEINEMTYGIQQMEGYHIIVSSGMAGWGYPFRTSGSSEYVMVDIQGK